MGKTRKFKSGKDWNGNAEGRPKGSKNKLTLLKEKLAKYAEENIDFDEVTTLYNKEGNPYTTRALPKLDILKIAAGLIPKEQKIEHSGEGFTVKLVDFSSACNLKEKDARDPDTK